MSILNKLSNLKKSSNTAARVAMTDLQVEQCKQALRRDNRGYNVQPNRFDIAEPYRVGINFNGTLPVGVVKTSNNWYNYGNFSSADVAAAVGGIVSSAFFGDNAKIGDYDANVVETHPEFTKWLEDPRNANVIAIANGEQPSMQDIPQTDLEAEAAASVNPF